MLDWDTVKREYIEGYFDANGNICFPSLRLLGERHGLSRHSLGDRCADEEWVRKRKEFQNQLDEARTENRIDLILDSSNELDSRAYKIAMQGLEMVSRRMKYTISNADLKKFGETATIFHKMGKLSIGEPTDHIREEGLKDVSVSIYDRAKEYEKYFKELESG